MKGRHRGRNGGKPRPPHGGGQQHRNYDQNFGRMRGNAQQLMDKYLAMARDANQAGDRVAAENFFQHADHYYRVLNARFEGQQQQNNQQRRFNGQGYDGGSGGDGGQQGSYSEQGPVDNQQAAIAPPPMMPIDQPHMTVQAHQHQHQPQPQPQPQIQPQPHVSSDGDIGLPPSLFGTPSTPPQTQFVSDGDGNNGGEDAGDDQRGGDDRGFRPRHGRRRRFRHDGPPRGSQDQGQS